LYEHWRGPDGRVINSCTLLTTVANDVLRPVHDRQPVMLHPADYDLWLDTDVRKRELLQELFTPYPAEEMTSYPVSALVNKPTIDNEKLINSL
jgi:putative SOS response-associated peptidase YedK